MYDWGVGFDDGISLVLKEKKIKETRGENEWI
jgi:hypothetical protein